MIHEREKTCCFTGHRPEKLPWKNDETDPRCIVLKKKIQDAVETAYAQGKRHFICGMARGCDFYFAEAVIALREEKGDVTLEAAIPCAVQSASWSAVHRERWKRLVSACDHTKVLQERYTPYSMLRRNRYMVEQSSLVIAVFDGSDGGTRRTLEYALQEKVELIIDLNPTEE